MIASLPMYDLPPTMAANDRLWAGIRAGLGAGPDALTRGVDDLMAQWLSPDLLLSQTCGMPYRTLLHDRVTLVGTPDFGVEGCQPGYYRSVLVAHADDARTGFDQFDGATLAYNETISQSGWAAPLNHAKSIGLTLRPAVHTGGHRLSLMAVAEGRAEIAALDAVSWGLFRGYLPAAQQVKVVGMTEPTPGLPYITASGRDAGRIFAMIAAAIAAMSDADRAATRLRGIVAIPASAYLAVPNPVAV
jgi:ABC-type phosphate/phosphonate transport system substrate-binding protein